MTTRLSLPRVISARSNDAVPAFHAKLLPKWKSTPLPPFRAPLRVVHDRVAGRVRFRHDDLVARPDRIQGVENALRPAQGLVSIRANALTESLLVKFRPPARALASRSLGGRRRRQSCTASLHSKLFDDFVYCVDFPGAGVHVCHELDISIAGELRIRE